MSNSRAVAADYRAAIGGGSFTSSCTTLGVPLRRMRDYGWKESDMTEPATPRPRVPFVPRQAQEATMASVHDVAAYILDKLGAMSTMKLQKLVYYSQAWGLVWDEKPLFPEPIQAWANGPVAPALYAEHRGRFSIERIARGNPDQLTTDERATVDAVIEAYGHLTGRQLSYITHAEDPWRLARAGLPDTARSEKVITDSAMADYYGAVDVADDAAQVDDLDWSVWDSTATNA